MAKLPEWLTREIGPLPVWGWLVAGAGGVGLGLVVTRAISNRQQSDAITVQPYGGGTVLAGAGDPTAGVGAGGGGGTGQPVGFEDNGDWRASALDVAIANGISPGAAEVALGAYFDGRQLTADEYAVIDLVLGELGLPPSPPLLVPPKPPDVPDVTPPTTDPQTSYTVVAGDTLSGIAQRFLGQSSRYPEIVAANPQITNPDLIYPGQTFVIPGASGPAPEQPATAGSYTVKRGDTLSGIASSKLGSSSRWREIFNLNRGAIDDPNLIYPGQVLQLPA